LAALIFLILSIGHTQQLKRFIQPADQVCIFLRVFAGED
jgi:hypothetical protein